MDAEAASSLAPSLLVEPVEEQPRDGAQMAPRPFGLKVSSSLGRPGELLPLALLQPKNHPVAGPGLRRFPLAYRHSCDASWGKSTDLNQRERYVIVERLAATKFVQLLLEGGQGCLRAR